MKFNVRYQVSWGSRSEHRIVYSGMLPSTMTVYPDVLKRLDTETIYVGMSTQSPQITATYVGLA